MSDLNFQQKNEIMFTIFKKVTSNQNDVMKDKYANGQYAEMLRGSKMFEDYDIAKVVESCPDEGYCLVARPGGWESILYAKRSPCASVGLYVLIDKSTYSTIDRGVISKELLEFIKKEVTKERALMEGKDNDLYWHLSQINFRGSISVEDLGEKIQEEMLAASERRTAAESKTKALTQNPNQPLSEEEKWKQQGIWNNAIKDTMTFGWRNQSIKIDKWWRDVEPNQYSLPRDVSLALTKLKEKSYEGDVEVTSSKGTFMGHLEPRKCTVEGTKVRKSRWFTFMRGLMWGNLKKEHIKLYNNLSNVKIELATTEKITIRRHGNSKLEVPFSAEFIDEDTVKIKFLNKEKTFPYSKLKEVLVSGASVRRTFCHGVEIFEFTKIMGLTQQETLEALKEAYLMSQI